MKVMIYTILLTYTIDELMCPGWFPGVVETAVVCMEIDFVELNCFDVNVNMTMMTMRMKTTTRMMTKKTNL